MENKTELQKLCIEFKNELFAAGVHWKDATTYSQTDRERIPTGFSTKIGSCIITITCGHRDYRPDWVFHCYNLGFDTSYLGKDLTPTQAAEMAVRKCGAKAKSLYEAFVIS